MLPAGLWPLIPCAGSSNPLSFSLAKRSLGNLLMVLGIYAISRLFAQVTETLTMERLPQQKEKQPLIHRRCVSNLWLSEMSSLLAIQQLAEKKKEKTASHWAKR